MVYISDLYTDKCSNCHVDFLGLSYTVFDVVTQWIIPNVMSSNFLPTSPLVLYLLKLSDCIIFVVCLNYSRTIDKHIDLYFIPLLYPPLVFHVANHQSFHFWFHLHDYLLSKDCASRSVFWQIPFITFDFENCLLFHYA